MGFILYCTLYGHMPRRNTALSFKPKSLWKRARKMEITPWVLRALSYPYGVSNCLLELCRVYAENGIGKKSRNRDPVYVTLQDPKTFLGNSACLS